MVSDEFLVQMAQIFPADRLLTNRAQLIPYESDALTAYRQIPLAVVIPETQREVVEGLRLCHKFAVPFVARGSGTSLSGGSLPIKNGVVFAMNRLKRIIKLDPIDRIAVVESGVINLDVSNAAAQYGLYFAPDPSSQPICTIGGNIAFNSGGAHCLKYGMTSNHILGIKAVLPDGEIIRLGGESLEGVGPDLVGLFVGSEGLFGIVLEATLRLLPNPEVFRTVLASYADLSLAGEAVSNIVAAGLLPGAMEIMDQLAVEAAQAAVNADYPSNSAAVLIVELDGEANQVENEFQRLMEIIGESGAGDVRVAQDDEDRKRIWQGRKSAFSAVGRLSPDYLVQDGVVPRSKLGAVLKEIENLANQRRIRVANVFHAGDGNLHPLILYNGQESGALNEAKTLAGEILDVCIERGGSITGEHGIGMEKRSYLPKMFSNEDIETLKKIRSAFDPQELSNRGKVFLDENTDFD